MEEAQENRDREIAALRARLEAAEKEHERGGLHLEEFLEENVAQPKAQMQQVKGFMSCLSKGGGSQCGTQR